MACSVSHRVVLAFGLAFWLCGSLVTGFMSVQSLLELAPKAVDKPARVKMYSLLAFGLGACASLFYVPCIFLPLARAEVHRIRTLDNPRPWHFFHRWRLLALCILIPAFSVISHKTSQYFVSCLVFGGTTIPVSAGLSSGALLLGRELACRRAKWLSGVEGEQLLRADEDRGVGVFREDTSAP